MGAGASSPHGEHPHGGNKPQSPKLGGSTTEGMSLNEENELLLEASHLMEGDILRMFNFIEGEGYELDSKAGVMAFLSSVLQSENLLKVCEHILMHHTHNPASSNPNPNEGGNGGSSKRGSQNINNGQPTGVGVDKSQQQHQHQRSASESRSASSKNNPKQNRSNSNSSSNGQPPSNDNNNSSSSSNNNGNGDVSNDDVSNDDVDGRAIVTGLWNFLTMDKTRLTGFVFSLYENVGKGFQGMSVASMREIVSDLHKEGEDHPMFTKMLQAAKKEPPVLSWDDFRRIIAMDRENEYLGPIFDSQLSLRQHLLGEEFWQRRQEVRSEVIGGTVIVGDELNELGRDGAHGRSRDTNKRHTILTVPDQLSGKRRISSALLGAQTHPSRSSGGARSSIFTRHSGKMPAMAATRGGLQIEEIPLAKRDSTHSQRAKAKSIVFSIPSGSTLNGGEGTGAKEHEHGRGSNMGLFGTNRGGGATGLAYSEAKQGGGGGGGGGANSNPNLNNPNGGHKKFASMSAVPTSSSSTMTPVMTSYASKATSHLMGGGGGGGGGSGKGSHIVDSTAQPKKFSTGSDAALAKDSFTGGGGHHIGGPGAGVEAK